MNSRSISDNTTVKASYQHGFRTPDAFYYVQNLVFKDAAESIGIDFPSLKIETMICKIENRVTVPEAPSQVERPVVFHKKQIAYRRGLSVQQQIQIGVTGNNIFKNDVPPMVFETDRLDRGAGWDTTRGGFM